MATFVGVKTVSVRIELEYKRDIGKNGYEQAKDRTDNEMVSHKEMITTP